MAARIASAFNLGSQLAGLLFAAFDTPKSAKQQARENRDGERAADRRNAEADAKIDFSTFDAARKHVLLRKLDASPDTPFPPDPGEDDDKDH